jgi:hypothetical protein
MQFYNQLIIFGVIYLLMVLALTYAGSKRKIGGERIFFISLILTPIAGVIVLLMSTGNQKEVKPRYYICKHCGFAIMEKKQFCPVCDKDEEGNTLLELRKEYLQKQIEPEEEQKVKSPRPKVKINYKDFNQN